MQQGDQRKRPSVHTIFSRIRNSQQYFLLNLLSGNADVLTPEEAAEWTNPETGTGKQACERKYLMTAEEEDAMYRESYLRFLEEREKEEIQLFFVPSYACNFDCAYCYQKEYGPQGDFLTPAVTDAFFLFVKKYFAGRDKYITLFGGEPLLKGEKHKEAIAYFVDKVHESGLSLAVVTNGYLLEEYIDILSKTSIREIQVTLDGTEQVHNVRRPLKGGLPTFESVVRGIDACLLHDLPVNLRVVVDRENINNIPALASFAIQKGWTQHPLFKTQLGRNYELHHCQATQRLFTRKELNEHLYDLIIRYPYIKEFYKPPFSVARYLAEQGQLPSPLFDSCPACKTEWAFDYTGKIYPCTATVGKKGEEVGSFYPVAFLNEEAVETWQQRDVVAIEACRQCPSQLACGGGCGAVAKNKNGSVLSPDCRPVKELLEMGFSAYLLQEENE